jgi:type VI secretion system protein ImpG
MDIWIYLDRIAKPNLLLDKSTFSLYTTPVINIFKRIAEPIRVEEEKTEYHVIPDLRRTEATEVFSIDSVMAATPDASEKERELRPFYSMKHHLTEDNDVRNAAFWHVRRRPSAKKGDDGTEVFLSFSDWNFRAMNADVETITVNVSCTNRDLPARLPFGDPAGDFEMETAAPVARISCIVKPTPTRRPALGGAMQWRLLSHLSLNYLSLVQGGEETLKEILKLYDFDNSPSTRQQINGIVSVQSDPITRRVGRSFCRGVQVTIEFDEDKYVGTGLYLFASVLEKFLGQYVSVNSFSQLVAKTVQRKERLSTWPPRSGNRMLI